MPALLSNIPLGCTMPSFEKDRGLVFVFDPLEGFDYDLNTSVSFLIEFQFLGLADFFPYVIAMISGVIYILEMNFKF